MESIRFVVNKDHVGLRLDQAIAANSSISRGKSRKIIDLGGAYVNRKRVRRSSLLVKEGDKIASYWRDEELQSLKGRPDAFGEKDILHEDTHFIVINKPYGLPSQGTRTQDIYHVGSQLEGFLRKSRGRSPSLRIAHRLDRDTTGVMVLCKTKTAYTHLSEAFKNRQVEKEYHTICMGLPKEKTWTQSEPLGKIDASLGRVYVDFDRGLKAKTEFSSLKENKEEQISLIQCKPITGRTHQIRAHLEYGFLPIMGDKNYTRDSWSHLEGDVRQLAAQHQMLHARSMKIPRLRGEGFLSFTASYPETFAKVQENLRL